MYSMQPFAQNTLQTQKGLHIVQAFLLLQGALGRKLYGVQACWSSELIWVEKLAEFAAFLCWQRVLGGKVVGNAGI